MLGLRCRYWVLSCGSVLCKCGLFTRIVSRWRSWISHLRRSAHVSNSIRRSSAATRTPARHAGAHHRPPSTIYYQTQPAGGWARSPAAFYVLRVSPRVRGRPGLSRHLPAPKEGRRVLASPCIHPSVATPARPWQSAIIETRNQLRAETLA